MPLSADEKERRRLATNARNRAYSVRRNERRLDETAGITKIATALAEKIASATATENAVLSNRDAALREIDQQIIELRLRRDRVSDSYNQEYQSARNATIAVYAEKHAAEKILEQSLNRKFPDLTGEAQWSASSWKPASENAQPNDT